MMYNTCPHCQSNLDPGEVCDCEKKKGNSEKTELSEMIAKVCKPPKE